MNDFWCFATRLRKTTSYNNRSKKFNFRRRIVIIYTIKLDKLSQPPYNPLCWGQQTVKTK